MSSFDFDLDDILSEFSDSSPKQESRPSEDVPSPPFRTPRQGMMSDPWEAMAAESRRRSRQTQELPHEEEEETVTARRSAREEPPKRMRVPVPEEQFEEPESEYVEETYDEEYDEEEYGYDEEGSFEGTGSRERPVSFVSKILGGVLFFGVIAAVSLWILTNIHPNVATHKTENVKTSTSLLERFSSLVNNVESDAMSDIVYIKKLYSIPEEASVAPKPSAACFGETKDPAEVQAVIDSAAELLDGQSTVWTPDTVTLDGSTIKYYCDDTILSIVWKEVIGNIVYTFAEVKIADGSQLRRHLAGDAYSSSQQFKASEMAATVNAVTAMNGDFYAFRQTGIVVYKRNLERFEPSTLDSCYFTTSGDMLFSHRGDLTSPEAVEQFIKDNDVLFSTSFGPILVENGQLVSGKEYMNYPIGEVMNKYSRSAIGMTGDRHYLLMAISTEKGYFGGVYVSVAGQVMYDKGCIKAYELDGGQTAVIVHDNEPANDIVYGSERTMSDIIYFATAIPEEEAKK